MRKQQQKKTKISPSLRALSCDKQVHTTYQGPLLRFDLPSVKVATATFGSSHSSIIADFTANASPKICSGNSAWLLLSML